GWVNLLLLGFFAWRRGYLGLDPIAWRRLVGIGAAGLVMAFALVILVTALAPHTGAGSPGWLRVGALAFLCLAGLAVFVLAALLTGGLDRRALVAAFRSEPGAVSTLSSHGERDSLTR